MLLEEDSLPVLFIEKKDQTHEKTGMLPINAVYIIIRYIVSVTLVVDYI